MSRPCHYKQNIPSHLILSKVTDQHNKVHFLILHSPCNDFTPAKPHIAEKLKLWWFTSNLSSCCEVTSLSFTAWRSWRLSWNWCNWMIYKLSKKQVTDASRKSIIHKNYTLLPKNEFTITMTKPKKEAINVTPNMKQKQTRPTTINTTPRFFCVTDSSAKYSKSLNSTCLQQGWNGNVGFIWFIWQKHHQFIISCSCLSP